MEGVTRRNSKLIQQQKVKKANGNINEAKDNYKSNDSLEHEESEQES
jgi:hypothetical protein